MRQIHRVAFIRINVHFELAGRGEAHEQILQDRGTGALDAEMDAVAILDAVVLTISWPHMRMALVANYAAGQLDHARRPHQVAAGRIAMIAALAHWDVQSERNRVRKCQFHLAVIAAGAEDAQVRDHPVPRAYDRDHLLGGEEPVLIEPLVRLELMASAEKPLE